MNRHVRGIMCMDGEIKLTRATIPILSRHHGRKPYVEAKSPSTETPDGPPVHQGAGNVNRPHTVKLAKFVTVPPMSQVAVPIRTEASGLLFLEPKHSVLAGHNVRSANGVAEVKGNRPFKIVLSNFSTLRSMLLGTIESQHVLPLVYADLRGRLSGITNSNRELQEIRTRLGNVALEHSELRQHIRRVENEVTTLPNENRMLRQRQPDTTTPGADAGFNSSAASVAASLNASMRTDAQTPQPPPAIAPPEL